MSPLTRAALTCVTGRFQPVHRQHMELFHLALAEAEHLVVAVTNPDMLARREEPASSHRHTGAANPLTYFERARLLTIALHADGLSDRFTIVPFDLTRPETWAEYVPRHARHFVRAYSPWERHKADVLQQQGYEVVLLEGDGEHKIASTDIRHRLRSPSGQLPLDPQGRPVVPPAVIPALREFMNRPGSDR